MSNRSQNSSAGSRTTDTGTNPRAKDMGPAPKKGDHYRCSKCGMSIEVKSDCGCNQPENVHFGCCGQNLQKV